MAQFIRLTGVSFGNANLTILNDLSEKIKTLPALKAWVNAGENNIKTDEHGDLVLIDKSEEQADFYKAPSRTYGPVLKINGLNGHNTISFNGDGGESGGLKRETSNMPVNTGQFTYACVVKVNENIGFNHNIIATGNIGTKGVPMYSSSNVSNFAMSGVGGNASASVSNGLNNWFILIGSFDNDSMQAKLLSPTDLKTVATAQATHSNELPDLFLGQNDSNSSLSVCELAEVIVTNNDLLAPANMSYLADVLDYFKSKFDL